MPDRLRFLVGGQIAASDINFEFNRGETSYFDIWTARNGGYGGINDSSGYRPTANGQDGYAFSHWWGYTHSASRPYVYIFKQENNASCSIRLYKYNPYGAAEWSERWYFFTIGPWQDASQADGYNGAVTPVRMDDRLTFLWNHFGWGNPWQPTYKAVYSPFRGNLLYWGCDPVIYQRYGEVNPIWGGEPLYVYSVEYYC
jgi:hypothetical protein